MPLDSDEFPCRGGTLPARKSKRFMILMSAVVVAAAVAGGLGWKFGASRPPQAAAPGPAIPTPPAAAPALNVAPVTAAVPAVSVPTAAAPQAVTRSAGGRYPHAGPAPPNRRPAGGSEGADGFKPFGARQTARGRRPAYAGGCQAGGQTRRGGCRTRRAGHPRCQPTAARAAARCDGCAARARAGSASRCAAFARAHTGGRQCRERGSCGTQERA